MTGEREQRIKKQEGVWLGELMKSELFKKHNKRWPPSSHYIHIQRPSIDANADKINEEWAEKTFFNKIIEDIMLDDVQYANEVWSKHAKSIISEQYVIKIEQMYKKSEGNCEPTID